MVIVIEFGFGSLNMQCVSNELCFQPIVDDADSDKSKFVPIDCHLYHFGFHVLNLRSPQQSIIEPEQKHARDKNTKPVS